MTDNNKNVPRHVAVIMDGNGRWAKARHLPRLMGHQAGTKSLERFIDYAKDLGVKYVSVYAFSTENWRRNSSEVDGLMGLFKYYLKGKLAKLHKRGARVLISGKLDDFPEDMLKIFSEAMDTTKDNDEITVVICANYGGRQELIDAVEKIRSRGVEGPITEEMIRSELYCPDVPDPDLLIRTGGELRVSNFLLWQSAYTEFYFTDVFWPDFDEAELDKAIASFAERERRYGTA